MRTCSLQSLEQPLSQYTKPSEVKKYEYFKLRKQRHSKSSKVCRPREAKYRLRMKAKPKSEQLQSTNSTTRNATKNKSWKERHITGNTCYNEKKFELKMDEQRTGIKARREFGYFVHHMLEEKENRERKTRTKERISLNETSQDKKERNEEEDERGTKKNS
ncbi:hypothetical protein RUM44_003500 [Polyplax serrata]|uniref:Uncharacterized protein n=1 Tax=Polyplax serrata TaxID=468196 RepID=A0ABR1AGL7_POLSC